MSSLKQIDYPLFPAHQILHYKMLILNEILQTRFLSIIILQNTGIISNAPDNSIMNVPFNINPVSLTTPPTTVLIQIPA